MLTISVNLLLFLIMLIVQCAHAFDSIRDLKPARSNFMEARIRPQSSLVTTAPNQYKHLLPFCTEGGFSVNVINKTVLPKQARFDTLANLRFYWLSKVFRKDQNLDSFTSSHQCSNFLVKKLCLASYSKSEKQNKTTNIFLFDTSHALRTHQIPY